LKKKLIFLLTISFFYGLNIAYSQNSTQKKDTINDPEVEKKPILLDNIKYDASDSIIIDQTNNKIILYNNAKIIYGDIELTSGLIILDYKENIVNAGRIADSEGNLSQYPTFTQGGNVVNPDDVVKDYGADSFRLYEMFMGPLEKSKPWSTTGLQGCFRFIQKIWRLFYENPEKIIEGAENQETKKLLHQTIKKITDDLENLRFNTSVSQLMILVNHFTSLEYLDKQTLRTFLILLNPFAPHISEELNQKLGYDPLHLCDWPSYDKSLIENDEIQIVVQLNGKKRGDIIAKKDSSQSEIQSIIDSDEKLQKYFVDVNIIKVIYVKGRIINFVVKK